MVGVLAVHIQQNLRQSMCRDAKVSGDADPSVMGQHVDIGNPQAMRQLSAALNMKALAAFALQMQKAWLRSIDMCDMGQYTLGVQTLCLSAGFAYFLARLKGDDAKGGLSLLAFANHVQIAHLKYLQA